MVTIQKPQNYDMLCVSKVFFFFIFTSLDAASVFFIRYGNWKGKAFFLENRENAAKNLERDVTLKNTKYDFKNKAYTLQSIRKYMFYCCHFQIGSIVLCNL